MRTRSKQKSQIDQPILMHQRMSNTANSIRSHTDLLVSLPDTIKMCTPLSRSNPDIGNDSVSPPQNPRHIDTFYANDTLGIHTFVPYYFSSGTPDRIVHRLGCAVLLSSDALDRAIPGQPHLSPEQISSLRDSIGQTSSAPAPLLACLHPSVVSSAYLHYGGQCFSPHRTPTE